MHELYKDANTDEIYREQITFRFDTNGKNPPNRTGRDVFCYDMTVWENNLVHKNNKRVEPCFAGYIGNRDDFTKTNGFCASDKTSHGLGCGALIQLMVGRLVMIIRGNLIQFVSNNSVFTL